MVKPIRVDSLYDVRYKNVHSDRQLDTLTCNLEQGVLLLDVLKTLETEIQKRNLLPSTFTKVNFHPLWFQAETERNVFLWRAGFSLIEKDEFEFWVNVPELIQKRLNSLADNNYESPFSNANWFYGDSDTDTNATKAEQQYLIELSNLFSSISEHATALCQASSMALKELSKNYNPKAAVILPGNKKKKIICDKSNHKNFY
jgi:hypothetical protein